MGEAVPERRRALLVADEDGDPSRNARVIVMTVLRRL
jgi:hypothetical protein